MGEKIIIKPYPVNEIADNNQNCPATNNLNGDCPLKDFVEICRPYDSALNLFHALYTMSLLTALAVGKRTFRCAGLGPHPDCVD